MYTLIQAAFECDSHRYHVKLPQKIICTTRALCRTIAVQTFKSQYYKRNINNLPIGKVVDYLVNYQHHEHSNPKHHPIEVTLVHIVHDTI